MTVKELMRKLAEANPDAHVNVGLYQRVRPRVEYATRKAPGETPKGVVFVKAMPKDCNLVILRVTDG